MWIRSRVMSRSRRKDEFHDRKITVCVPRLLRGGQRCVTGARSTQKSASSPLDLYWLAGETNSGLRNLVIHCVL